MLLLGHGADSHLLYTDHHSEPNGGLFPGLSSVLTFRVVFCAAEMPGTVKGSACGQDCPGRGAKRKGSLGVSPKLRSSGAAPNLLGQERLGAPQRLMGILCSDSHRGPVTSAVGVPGNHRVWPGHVGSGSRSPRKPGRAEQGIPRPALV